MKKAFTMMELIIVIIIISVIFGMAMPGFNKMKEDNQDKKATSNLRLMQAAEKVYCLENNCPDNNSYYASSVLGNINDNLKLLFPTADTNWTYTTKNTGCVQATRNGGNNQQWYFRITDTDETSKPNVGICP